MTRYVPPLILLRLLAALALALAAGPALARGNPDAGADICERAAAIAAAESGVPPDILGALTLTETGRKRGGIVRPWAWSVNAEGAGEWFDDPAAALRFAESRVAAGRPNVDIGCFQINYRWHGQHFASVAEMFDPLANARYAARFVRELYQDTGDWRAAAGAFHSRTPQHATRYLARFDQLRAQLRRRGFAGMDGAPGTYNRFADHAAPGGPDLVALYATQRAGPDGIPGLPDSRLPVPGLPVPGLPASGGADVVTLDDPALLAALDRMAAASGGAPRPRRNRDPDNAMLLGAPRGTAAAGGGSLAALGNRQPILTGANRPMLANARPLPNLPGAANGPPASGSSLWMLAEKMDGNPQETEPL